MRDLLRDKCDLLSDGPVAYSVCQDRRTAEDVVAGRPCPALEVDGTPGAALTVMTDGSIVPWTSRQFRFLAAQQNCAPFYRPGLERTPAGLYVIANMAAIRALEGSTFEGALWSKVTFGSDANPLQADWELPMGCIMEQLLIAGFDFDVYCDAERTSRRFVNFGKSEI